MKSHSTHRIQHTAPFIVKVCGITQAENLKALAGLPIDWFGFIRYSKSNRFVGEAEIINENLPQNKVAVFVDVPLEEVVKFIASYPIDLVQLHGKESPDYCKQLRKNGLGIIKAFSVDDSFDFTDCEDYAAVCDFFLFDTKGKMPGGNGVRFKWDILKNYNGPVPFLLSGGIGPEQMEELQSFSHPFWRGIDLNSRFEVTPGIKDVKKVALFLKNKNQMI